MKAVFSVCVAAALLLSVGCSSEPTADDFEAFAQSYAEKATRDWPADNGVMRNVKAKLIKHDLRKTDSLTSPFVGTAVYEVEISNVAIRHPDVSGYETTANYLNDATVQFAFRDGTFEPSGGTSTVSAVNVLNVPDEVIAKMRNMTGATKELSLQEINEARIYVLNGWSSITMDEIKEHIRSITPYQPNR